jgi:hypothetical protein
MSSNVAEPELRFSPMELYNTKWSIIARFTFFNHYSLMSCTCEFPVGSISISGSQKAVYSFRLLLCLYWQGCNYPTRIRIHFTSCHLYGIQEVCLEGLDNSWPKLRNWTLTELSSSFITISMLKISISWTKEESFLEYVLRLTSHYLLCR